jgi:glutathione S-transferase
MSIIYGVSPSPFVRKVMLAHAHKKIPFDMKMTMPNSDDEEFRQASPSGKIPGYKTDDGVAFADSSVIVAYLERISSDNALYPERPSDYAQALWFEEWGDTELMAATGALYFQRVIGPIFLGQATDLKRVDEIVTDLIPKVFELLESRLSEQGWLVGDSFSIADMTIGSCLVNLLHADYQIEQSRWPKLHSYNERFLALPIVNAQIATEQSVINQAGA